MSERQEMVDDIIAEMLGARTEFPFVYLMGEPDTPEVIDPKTKKIIEPRKINIRRVTVKELACRLKAAHKRERGDSAKQREALKDIVRIVEQIRLLYSDFPHEIHDIARKARAALAAPPRNCDIYLTEEAVDAATVTVRDCEECSRIDMEAPCVFCMVRWLLAPAQEKEGGVK